MEAHDQVVVEPDEVNAKLSKLGLTAEVLRQAVGEAAQAKFQTTVNHPATAGGSMQWFEAVRSLRDQLIPISAERWEANNSLNRGLVVNPKRGVVLGVAGGDANTGIPSADPTTRSPKGNTTKDAVITNQMRFEEFREYFGALNPKTIKELGTLWLLLIFVNVESGQARSELSRPIHWGDAERRPVGFSPRIILPPVDLDGRPMIALPKPSPEIPQAPEMTVEIKRRA
jgi:hypothetical protein